MTPTHLPPHDTGPPPAPRPTTPSQSPDPPIHDTGRPGSRSRPDHPPTGPPLSGPTHQWDYTDVMSVVLHSRRSDSTGEAVGVLVEETVVLISEHVGSCGRTVRRRSFPGGSRRDRVDLASQVRTLGPPGTTPGDSSDHLAPHVGLGRTQRRSKNWIVNKCEGGSSCLHELLSENPL